jgi:hypothetical protein
MIDESGATDVADQRWICAFESELVSDPRRVPHNVVPADEQRMASSVNGHAGSVRREPVDAGRDHPPNG